MGSSKTTSGIPASRSPIHEGTGAGRLPPEDAAEVPPGADDPFGEDGIASSNRGGQLGRREVKPDSARRYGLSDEFASPTPCALASATPPLSAARAAAKSRGRQRTAQSGAWPPRPRIRNPSPVAINMPARSMPRIPRTPELFLMVGQRPGFLSRASRSCSPYGRRDPYHKNADHHRPTELRRQRFGAGL